MRLVLILISGRVSENRLIATTSVLTLAFRPVALELGPECVL